MSSYAPVYAHFLNVMLHSSELAFVHLTIDHVRVQLCAWLYHQISSMREGDLYVARDDLPDN